MGSIPDQGTKIPHGKEQEPVCRNYWALALQGPCATTSESTDSNERNPREPMKTPRAATKTQRSQMSKINF